MTSARWGERKGQEFFVSRRDFLITAGKYSAVAACALAGVGLGASCGGGGGGDGGDGGTCVAGGANAASAPTVKLGDCLKVSLASAGAFQYFKFTAQAPIDVVGISVSSCTGKARFAVMSDGGSQVVLEEHDLDTPHTITGSCEAGTYYLRFQAVGGAFETTARLASLPAGSWSNAYSDWSNAWTNYSDWSNNTWSNSGWSNAYSDWSNAWHHAYSDWSNAWGNWMQSW